MNRFNVFLYLVFLLSHSFSFGAECEEVLEVLTNINRDKAADIGIKAINKGKTPKAEITDGNNVLSPQRVSSVRTPALFKHFLPEGVEFIGHQGTFTNPLSTKLNSATSSVVPLRVPYEHDGKTHYTEALVSHHALINNFIQSLKDTRSTKKWLVDPEARAVILFLHGGGTTTAGSMAASSMANHFSGRGIDVISFDQVFHGQGTRQLHGVDPLLSDIQAIGSFLKKYVPPDMPIYLYGHSWGGLFTDAIMRFMDAGTLDVQTFIPQLKGMVNASGPPPVSGESIKEMVDDFVRSEIESIGQSKTKAPPQERNLIPNFAQDGRLGFFQQFYINIQWLQRSLMNKPLTFNKKTFVPYYVVMGRFDPNVYLAREESFENSYQDIIGSVPFDLFKIYLFNKLYYREEGLLEVGHLIGDYRLNDSGKSVDNEIVERMIYEVTARDLGLIKVKSSKIPQTLEDLNKESITDLANPTDSSFQKVLSDMKKAFTNDSDVRSDISGRLQRELGYNKHDANVRATTIKNFFNAFKLFSDDLSFRHWIEKFKTHYFQRQNTIARKLEQSRNRNRQALLKLLQSHHPVPLIRSELEKLTLLDPQSFDENILIESIRKINDLRDNNEVRAKFKALQPLFEKFVKEGRVEQVQDFINEVRSIMGNQYKVQEVFPISIKDVSQIFKSDRNNFDKFLENYPYSEKTENNPFRLSEDIKQHLILLFEAYQNPKYQNSKKQNSKKQNSKKEEETEFQTAIVKDVHNVLKIFHPSFQTYEILKKIYGRLYKMNKDEFIRNNLKKLKNKAEFIYRDSLINTRLDEMVEIAERIRSDKSEGNTLENLNNQLDQIRELAFRISALNKNPFLIRYETFYISQFNIRMNINEFEKALEFFNISDKASKEFVDNFLNIRTNVPGNNPFIKELREHSNQHHYLNEIIEDITFPDTYINELNHLSQYFSGKMREDLIKVISDLESRNREIATTEFMLKYYYSMMDQKIKLGDVEEQRRNVENFYPDKIKDEILRLLDAQEKLDNFKTASDVPTLEDFYEASGEPKSPKLDEQYKTTINRLRIVVNDLKEKEKEFKEIERALKTKLEEMNKTKKSINEANKKFQERYQRNINSELLREESKLLEEEAGKVEELVNELLKKIAVSAGDTVEKFRLQESPKDLSKIKQSDLEEIIGFYEKKAGEVELLNEKALSKAFNNKKIVQLINDVETQVDVYKKADENLRQKTIDLMLKRHFGAEDARIAISLFGWEEGHRGDNLNNQLAVYTKDRSNLEIKNLQIQEDITNLKEDYYQFHYLGNLETSHSLYPRDVFGSNVETKTPEELDKHLTSQRETSAKITAIWKEFKASLSQ